MAARLATKIVRVEPSSPQLEFVREAARIIAAGGLVAFPTETVYGLGADAMSERAALKIFVAKGRPPDNPLIVHISEGDQLSELALDIPRLAEKLMASFWPGPLTLLFKRKQGVPDVTVAGLDTVAVRMPSHPTALSLIAEAGVPVAAPSANLSGSPSPTRAEHVVLDLYGKIDMIMDGGSTPIGIESTVLDTTVEPPVLLRPGAVTLEELRECIGEVKVHPGGPEAKGEARSPGMRHRHYAPRAKVLLVEGDPGFVRARVSELAGQFEEAGVKVGVLAAEGHSYRASSIRFLGKKGDERALAKNLFSALRELDEEGVEVILAEGVERTGLGLAIMDRLARAAEGRCIRVGVGWWAFSKAS